MIKKIFKIRCLTNMHVGSGDINFNIIDNQVQRDLITNLPTINSSGLKGSFREFSNEYGISKDEIEFIFGSEADNSNNNPGNYKIFSANLLVLPVRSNKKPFFRATSKEVLKSFLEYAEDFGLALEEKFNIEDIIKNIKPDTGKPVIFEKFDGNVILEDYIAETSEFKLDNSITSLIGDNLAIFSNDDFKEISKNLPVIARNKLVNGESKNLWYEEIVPRETVFFFGILTPEEKKEFESKLTDKNTMVQIGANASIGYGYTKIDQIVGDK